jgi:hypothetical protein
MSTKIDKVSTVANEWNRKQKQFAELPLQNQDVVSSIMQATRVPWGGCVVPVEVTPELAEQWLARNTRNRKPLIRWIARLKDIILRGEWRLAPSMVAFDWNGVLLDGQNRLYAIAQSKVAAPLLVGFGFDPACFSVLDSGAKRTFANVLTIEKAENYVPLAAAYSRLWKYLYFSREMTGGGPVPTSQQLLELRSEHPEIAASVQLVRSGWKIASVATLSFCHYLFSRKDDNLANDFMTSLIAGTMLQENSPVKMLRDRLESNRASKAKLSEREIIALIFKTWNYVREGREYVRFLRWSPGQGEQFPEVK